MIHCLIFPSFDLIPENYHKIKNIIPEYYNYEINFDNNGSPFASQITILSPKIKDEITLQKLLEFDKNEFEKTVNYNIIKEIYGKEYLYNKNNNKIEYKRKRKNEIFKENYDYKNVDIYFPSIENISNFKYIEGYFKRNIGGNKIKEINSLFIYVSLDEKKYKKINQIIINDIFKEKIISYGYPFIKLGILKGLYYDDKYYSLDENTKTLKQINCQYEYDEQIKKDYEFIGLKILDLSCLIEVIPILDFNKEDIMYDYKYKYLIPLEITSLNILNKTHKEYIKSIIKNNNFKYIKLDEDLIKKNKSIFLYDENGKNKENRDKDKKSKITFREKKMVKKNRKSKGPLLEKEITNFKFKDIADYY